jgi:SAM-dependent methyltransferase
MSETSRHDAWQAGDSYDAYMGRWSRRVAPLFLDWLAAPEGLDWLEVGCGTGALTGAILDRCAPSSVVSVDPSEGFLAQARRNVSGDRVEFRIGDAQDLSLPDDSRDVAASALAVNFVPDRARALAEMVRVVRPGGLVGFYVWDYPGGGIEFMRRFWTAAVALDGAAAALTEDRRFPFCTEEGLRSLAQDGGLDEVDCRAVEVPTVFRDFDDYWTPFTLGAGPAPGYCASLAPPARERLRNALRGALPANGDGSISLVARAWALKGRVP